MAQWLVVLTALINASQTFALEYPRDSCMDHPWNAENTVITTSGPITGHLASGYPSVTEFLGIPFAEPPIGSLRFAPPVLYAAKGPITADRLPKGCTQSPNSVNHSLPQPARNILGAEVTNSSGEDCLYLNVWTKSLREQTWKRPVLLWIYGGGFHSGSASDPAQQGGLWAAEEDVVVVNFNYRLGVFGFPGGVGLSQNVGLLDQRLVVEWVRDNIEAFGGDATRITLFGHSAGGASVDYYNYAYEADPIVAGTIAMSGSVTTFGHRSTETAQQAWDSLAGLLGCDSVSNASKYAVTKCVRGKSTAEVFNASLRVGDEILESLSPIEKAYAGITGIWSPTTDNQTVFSNYSILGQQGRFIKRPAMVGSNSDEACLFIEKGQIPASDGPLLTDAVFTCPINWAGIYRASNNLPTWKYRWLGSFPNLEFNACPGQPWHGQELYVLFGSSASTSGEAATPRERAAGRYLRATWTAFARDPMRGLSNRAMWPTFNSNESEVIALGLNSTTPGFSEVDATKIDANCFTAFRYGGPNY